MIVPIQVCEEITRPSALLSPTKVRYLPKALIELREKVMDPLSFLDLPLGPRRVLRALLAFASKEHFFDWVFPSRRTLAAEAHLGSLPTLYRHLKTLEVRGYIIRRQLRDEGGSYSMSHIQFTDKAAALLGIRTSRVGRDGGVESFPHLREPAPDSTGQRRSPRAPSRTLQNEISIREDAFAHLADFEPPGAEAMPSSPGVSAFSDKVSPQDRVTEVVSEFTSIDHEFIVNSSVDTLTPFDSTQKQSDASSLSAEFSTFRRFPQKPRIKVIGGVYKSERTRHEQLKGSADRATNKARPTEPTSSRLRDRRRDSDIDPETRIPRELTGLLQHLSRSTICYLMKLCALHGKRLGDIWAVQAAYIERMKGSVAGFLVSEIRKDVDYAWLRTQRSHERTTTSSGSDKPQALARRLNALADELLKVGQGRVVCFGSDTLGSISSLDKAVITPRGVLPVNGRFISGCLNGQYSVSGISISLESGLSLH